MLKAVEDVNKIITKEIENKCIVSQRERDYHMIGMAGTANKSKLGARAILGESMAKAKAMALNSCFTWIRFG